MKQYCGSLSHDKERFYLKIHVEMCDPFVHLVWSFLIDHSKHKFKLQSVYIGPEDAAETVTRGRRGVERTEVCLSWIPLHGVKRHTTMSQPC